MTFAMGVAFVVGAAAVNWWHAGQHEDDVTHGTDVAVIQTEVTHIKDTLEDMKEAQKANQAEILNLLRNMPR
jgi:endonuclease III-like uncharacterized protein